MDTIGIGLMGLEVSRGVHAAALPSTRPSQTPLSQQALNA